MDGGVRWATVHRVTESDTTERLHFHFQEMINVLTNLIVVIISQYTGIKSLYHTP